MSDELNWKAIGVWVSAVGFQVGTALWRLCKNYKSERPVETGYQRVRRGETVEGWKLVISSERIPKDTEGSLRRNAYRTLIMPPWRNDSNDIHSEFMDYSLLMNFWLDTPDGRKVYALSRYSLIADFDTTIVRIAYDERQWVCDCTCFLSHRIVVVACHCMFMPHRCRLVLVDIASKRYQTFLVEAPFELPGTSVPHTVRRHGSSTNKLIVLYRTLLVQGPIINEQEIFCDATYDIPTTDVDADAVIKASSRETPFILPDSLLTVLTSMRFSGFPPIIFCRDVDPNGVESHHVVSFDQPGKWQITPMDDWLTSFRSTQFGQRFIVAADALDSLSPPPPSLWIPTPQVQYIAAKLHDVMYGYENSRAVYSVNEGGVMRRWMNPPSLRYLAAEAFCRAHHNVNTSELKDRLGFDVFDGMMDKTGDYSIIYL